MRYTSDSFIVNIVKQSFILAEMSNQPLPSWIASKKEQEIEWPSDSSDEEEPTEHQPSRAQEVQIDPQSQQGHTASLDLRKNDKNNDRKQEEQEEQETKSLRLNTSSRSLSQLITKRMEGSRDESTSAIFTCPEEKMIVVMDHLVKAGGDKERAVRMSKVIMQMQDGKATIRQGIMRMNPKDLDIIAEHKLLLSCLQEIIILVLAKMPAFASLKQCNFFKIIDLAYQDLAENVNFQSLRLGLIKSINELNPNRFSMKLIEQFAKKIILHTEGSFQRKKAEKKRLRNKKLREIQATASRKRDRVFHRIQGVQEEQGNANFDGQSLYGLFQNKKEEFQRSNQGIYNYRIHRTLNFIAKLGTLDPFRNMPKAMDYALFFIKLMDLHLLDLMKRVLIASKLDLQNKVTSKYSGVQDQFSYFHPDNYKPKDDSAQRGNTVTKCVYPSLLTKYNDLRFKEISSEDKLHMEMYPQIFLFMSKNQRQGSKLQRKINDYYEYAQISKEVVQQFKIYREPSRPHLNKIKIETEHLMAVLQEHPLYSNSPLLLRLRAFY